MNVAWDPAKNRENQEKQGISSDDAQTVFQDPDRIDDLTIVSTTKSDGLPLDWLDQ